MDILPCGCRCDTIEDAFYYEPCSPTCEYYIYAQEEAKRQAMPIINIIDPTMSQEELKKWS